MRHLAGNYLLLSSFFSVWSCTVLRTRPADGDSIMLLILSLSNVVNIEEHDRHLRNLEGGVLKYTSAPRYLGTEVQH